MKQQGVKLKVGWYGNPEGTELWDLDPQTMSQLIARGKAESIERDVKPGATLGGMFMTPTEPTTASMGETEELKPGKRK